jgi:tetratricopeptide (TPR) repeat protein
MLAKASTNLAEAKAQLTKATTDLNSAQALKVRNQSALDKAQDALDSAKAKFDSASDAVDTAQERVQEAQDALDTAKADLDTATEDMKDADASVSQQEQIRNDAQVALDTAQTNLTSATSNLQTAQNTRASAQANVATKQSAYTQAQQATLTAQLALQTAQANYNSSQVPNPNYVSPYTTNVIPNLLFNSDFSRGNEGWSGVSIGWQNSQPGYFNGNIAFSYMNQTVEQGLYSGPFNNATLTLFAEWFNDDSNRNITDSYSMTVSARDINQNPVGSATFTSDNTRHNWETKSVTLVATGPVSYITVSFSGIDNGFWAGNYGPRLRNPQLQVSSQTPTNNAPATQTGTMQVSINEGGESTFVAPNGGTFISSNLRYEAIDDPSCGADVSPTLGGNTITLAADNGVWGDPCGGWYKRIVGTLTYSSSQPQFIKDPNLLLQVQSSEANLTSAQQAEQTAQQNLAAATAAASTSNEAAQDKEDELTAAQTSYEEALEIFNTEEADLTNLENTSIIKRTSYEASLEVYETAGSNFTAAQESFDEVSSDVDSTKGDYDSALENFQEAETTFNDSDADEQSAQTDVEKAQDAVDIAQDELDSIPEYEPEEPKAPEIPEGDPRELSEEQVEELVAEAEAVLETAEQGSPAYEQALEALAVAAQADDPQIPSELAAIPLLGETAAAVLEAFNDLGNVGADMAPAVREEAEKTVIASVIATGAAVQAVQAAAASAASAATASAGASGGASGSSGSTRKIK